MDLDGSEIFDGFDPMGEDYVKTLNSNYFGGPGFAIPDVQNGTKPPLHILVENIPEDLKREGLIRAFKLVNVFPITCKLLPSKGLNKAILQVRSITDATTAIQALNNRPPLHLRVTLAADEEDFENKKDLIQREQRAELAKHLRALARPLNKMGELVNNLCAVENLFKILSTRDEMCQVCTAEPLIRHVHFIASEEIVIDPFQDLPQSFSVACSYCCTKDGKFVVCSRCQTTSYCGLRCQSLDWLSHRKKCSPQSNLSNGDSHLSDESNIITKLTTIKKQPLSPKVEVAPKVTKVEEKVQTKPIPSNPPKSEIKQEVKPTESYEVKKAEVKEYHKAKVPEVSPPAKLPSPQKVIQRTIYSDNNVGRIINPANFIQEPNKIITPRIKISLNNEVNHIRETKLEFNTITEVVFSFCYNPSDFFVQRAVDTPEAEAITEKLFEICQKANEWPDANKLKPGNYCAARFDHDGYWYRAKVLGFKNNMVEVKFIDYGNRDIVNFEALRPLPPEMVAIPALAVNCALKFVKPLFESGWNREASKFFEDQIADEAEIPYNNCKVYNEFDGVHQVELISENGEKLNDLLVQKGLAKGYEEIRKPLPPRIRRNPDLSTSPPEIGKTHGGSEAHNENKMGNGFNKPKPDDIEPVRVKPSPIEVSPPRPKPVEDISPGEAYKSLQKTPASFYHLYSMGSIKEDEAVLLYNDVDDPSIVFLLGNNDSMLKLCAELGTIEERGVHIEPKPGLLAVAPADDGDFYRVVVMEVDGDKCRVFYLDFGNTDWVKNAEILKLPSKINLEKIPAQGIRCRIDNMDKIENFETRLADRIGRGTPADIKVVRKISDHEYAIELTL
ncbi:uncharacterized protein LOC128398243 isoform X2 [Panonychus citri]|uniref:uncharacterized protein LOC128398243 isoform X2 n=1 Tax=Panonychus citri TaxID=50023 RepID=UPI002307A9C2|nr:uncharacterized protein LOC128398243 isoform X2 [Panonychus citri]